MKIWKLDVLTSEQVSSLSPSLSKKNNPLIVETAGFVPLEVKFKQFEQNGIINQLQQSDFTSSDYRELYLHPDFDITPEDDFEEVQEKLESLQRYRQQLEEQIKARKSGEELEKEKPSVQKTEDEQKENKE